MRALDLGTMWAELEGDAPRVACSEHGVVVAHVPWARHGAGHTTVFDEQVAWLATQTSKTAITELMRIAWRTVGSILARVWADTEALHDRFAGLSRIGIREGLALFPRGAVAGLWRFSSDLTRAPTMSRSAR